MEWSTKFPLMAMGVRLSISSPQVPMRVSDFVVLVGSEHRVGDDLDFPFVDEAKLFGKTVVELDV
jgi:hypothetical protein